MHDFLAYIVVVKIKGLKSKFYNSFISASKCRRISKGYYDNGRIISADEIEICLTDVDFYFILDSYKYDSYEIIESYYSKYNYLPKQFINFVLDKYVEKTKLKNVEGMEVDYNIVKQLFNSTYGMSVTNNIRSEVLFFNDGDIQKEENENKNWKERELTNEEIQEALFDEKKKAFMSFSWRCLVYGFRKEQLA